MKKSQALTCAQLGAAFEAAEASGLYRDGPAARTLNALIDVLTTDAARDSEPARVAEGTLPVTSAQVDEALAELREIGVDAKALRVLRQGRQLIARAEKQRAVEQAAAGPQYATRQELNAALEAMGAALGCAAHEFGKTSYRQQDLIRHLSQTANQSSSLVRPFLSRLVDAVCEYREPKKVRESDTERFAREAYGVSRSRL
ncbi:MAG TPA: hypothetical protein VFX20_13945 [Steroidobacteraceae bacterium]|nr:hypothetical protein [Steroidobacteraceae bacterium]